MQQTAEQIFYNGQITTLDDARSEVTALAVKSGRILATGSDQEIMKYNGSGTEAFDLRKRRVIPGLIDSHLHIIRGGLNYNMELRWDGVESLATAMEMLKVQTQNTPAPQWVRVVGGFTAHQFREKRLPTLDEINAASPDTPVFILHLYDRALLNRAALQVCGFTAKTPDPPGGKIERDAHGQPTGMMVATPNAMILYSTLAKGPKLPREYQLNSTLHFMRELNRLGVTGAIDAGGGFQNYPEDYEVIAQLAKDGQLTVRIAYNLFTQKPKGELEDFARWTKSVTMGQGDTFYHHNGAGEMLVFSAADFEDFREPRPDMPPSMEEELERVVRLLLENRWAFRLHATYDETIGRALNVFEKVNRDLPLNGIHWFFDHAETISQRNIDRVAQLGGGIAVQHRMAYQGEYFVERYGSKAAERSPPIQAMRAAGLRVGGGTDATRVASYNPWICLSWLVTGRTVAGLKLYHEDHCLDRKAALQLWTADNAWFSHEEGQRGQLKVGQLADLIALSDDYFAIAESEIKNLSSVLTVVGGKIVFGDEEFKAYSPPLPQAMPDWSPVRRFGGYQSRLSACRSAEEQRWQAAAHTTHSCMIHDSPKRMGSNITEALREWRLGCMCWAF